MKADVISQCTRKSSASIKQQDCTNRKKGGRYMSMWAWLTGRYVNTIQNVVFNLSVNIWVYHNCGVEDSRLPVYQVKTNLLGREDTDNVINPHVWNDLTPQRQHTKRLESSIVSSQKQVKLLTDVSFQEHSQIPHTIRPEVSVSSAQRLARTTERTNA